MRFRRFVDWDLEQLPDPLPAILAGREARPLTLNERRTLALASVPPLISIDIHADGLDRVEMLRRFHAWRRRVTRRRKNEGPLLYVATLAASTGSDGAYHVHVLLWEYLPVGMTKGAAREVGLGTPHHTYRPRRDAWPPGFLRWLSYRLSQHESVFGSHDHLRHQPLPAGKHGLLHPRLGTFRSANPELFDAWQAAADRSIPDLALLDRTPMSSRRYRGAIDGLNLPVEPAIPEPG